MRSDYYNEKYAAEIAAAKQEQLEFLDFMRSAAGNMTDTWTLSPFDDYCYSIELENARGQKLQASNSKGRIRVSILSWPQTNYGARIEGNNWTDYPGSEITLAANKPAAKVGTEIERRLMPIYRAYWEKAEQCCREWEQRRAKEMETMSRIALLAGLAWEPDKIDSSQHGYEPHIYLPHKPYSIRVKVSGYGGEIHLTLNRDFTVTEAEGMQILRILLNQATAPEPIAALPPSKPKRHKPQQFAFDVTPEQPRQFEMF